jgi:Tol biopolymer transport system component
MKRFVNIAGGLLGLLILGGLLIAYILSLGGLQDGADPEPQAYPPPMESTLSPPAPAGTSTLAPYPPPEDTLPPPPPTSTRPPDPPTRLPTLTFTPAPPTPTPQPLPTLIPGLETMFYTTTGERGPELNRIQIDQEALLAGPPQRVDTPILWHSRIHLGGLYPSPDGRRIAVAWTYGEGGTFVSILDVNDGVLTPLFDELGDLDKRVEFLDWSPDGNSLLVVGEIGNPDLGGSVWLVNLSTYQYTSVNIVQESEARQITSASFSPDGQTVVYAGSVCYRCGGEIWRVSLGGTEQQLLLQDSEFRIEDVLWSPDGRSIAYTRWQQPTSVHSSAIGELWVMDAAEDARRFLSPVVTGYYKQFCPAWSPNSQKIAFVSNQDALPGAQEDRLFSNIYAVDALSGVVTQLTGFDDVEVVRPTWSPDGSKVAFVASLSDAPGQFEPWVVATDGGNLHRLDQGASLIMDSRAANPLIIWLPEYLPGDGQ